MKKILVVDDEKVVLDFMSFILQEFSVDTALSVSEALELLAINRYDLVITDLIMYPIDGFELLKRINPQVPIIVLSSLSDRDSLIKAYDLGVVDYLIKPLDELIALAKIKNLLQINTQHDVLFNDDLTVDFFGELIVFTKTEYNILKLLCNSPSHIFSKEDLINEIWFGNDSMSSKIIDVNISNIRKKLGSHGEKIHTIRNVGYKYEK